ncbi:squalene synthase HpnD [bacterium]|nr:MAG: squalene synthase HpnD [bacterium]
MSALVQAQERCAQITRSKGPNFSVGFELLPTAKKAAVHACYAFCRLVDDLVDELPASSAADPLEEWREELDRAFEGQPRHEVGVALAAAADCYPIRKESFAKLIRGCEEDLDFHAPRDLAALGHYCDLVATPIGEMSLAIFGGSTARAKWLGRELSHALQLTNILRDVREDCRRGRVYLPATWLAEAGVSCAELDQDQPGAGFTALMERGIDRAREHYRNARDLPGLVAEDSRAAVRLMAGVYEEILDRIAHDPGAVLRQRVGLSASEKTALVQRLAGSSMAAGGES